MISIYVDIEQEKSRSGNLVLISITVSPNESFNAIDICCAQFG